MNPFKTLLIIVIEAMNEQEDAKHKVSFDSIDSIIGNVFIKLDGISSGRAADCVLWVSGKSIKFVGTG